MPRYLILRQSHTPPESFGAVKEVLRQGHLWQEKGDGKIPEWEAFPQGATSSEYFDRAAAFISVQLDEERSVVALVDEVDPALMNPLMSKGWSTLIAMLVMAFPEVRWHFLVVTGRPKAKDENGPAEWDCFFRCHGAGPITEARGTALFDGYGLRDHIREVMRRDGSSSKRPSQRDDGVPRRDELAVVLDDESGFSQFCGLMVYRNGFRAHAIASWSEAQRLLAGPSDPHAAGMIALSIEDWYLGFADGSGDHVSDLQTRQDALPALGANPLPIRRFVTVGHDRQKGTEAQRRAYLRELRLNERLETGRPVTKSCQVVYKPASGLHTLWDKLGFPSAFRITTTRDKNSPDYRHAHGLAKGYIWPPPKPDKGSATEENHDGHSAPGRLLQISEHLIQRATKLLEEVATVSDAVRGAVLATQALELLGGKTPTVAVDALALKHEFEVIAECQFVGVEFHLSMKERLAEIRQNLRAMKHWLHRDRQEAFLLNSEARIDKRIISVLDEYGEYEESVTCQNRLRTLHRKIRQHDEWRETKIWRMALWPVNTYLEWVASSFLRFVAAVTTAICIFTLTFHLLGVEPLSMAFYRTICALHTVGLPEPVETIEVASLHVSPFDIPVTVTQIHNLRAFLGYFTALFGVTNFGIFISMLYSRISRR
jgi:hypothetical protein